MFNPNELILEKIRSVEEYDPATDEMTGRYTQIEEPTLQLTADPTDVTDAMGAPIQTFYNAQSGTFAFTNSLHSLDLWVSQFGTKKEIASDTNKILVPVSETIDIASDHTVTLRYVPVGTAGAEVKYVKIFNGTGGLVKTYEVAAAAEEGKFTLDAENRKITLPDDASGRAFVNYTRESSAAVKVAKRSDSVPDVKTLLIHAIFHDPCNKNIVYAGVIRCPRAQVDPSSIDLNLTSDGRHSANYLLQKPYCDETANLVEIIVSEE